MVIDFKPITFVVLAQDRSSPDPVLALAAAGTR